MSRRSRRSPDGYDVTKRVGTNLPGCHLTAGFDRGRERIPSFLVLLHYRGDTDTDRWNEIARMDHNENNQLGHDVYKEGLHVDMSRRTGSTIHAGLSHGALPSSRGRVIRACINYFIENAQFYIDVFEGDRSPGSPPQWPDGGEPPHTLITTKPVDTDMSHEVGGEEILTVDEFTELLAEETGETPEEIARGAEEIDIAPPEEATILDE